MKLLRWGPKGAEKPGMLDASGGVRDLSGTLGDLAGDALTPASLDRLRGSPRPSAGAVCTRSASPNTLPCRLFFTPARFSLLRHLGL